MNTEDIATREQLLDEIAEVLKTTSDKSCGNDAILDQLIQHSLILRRELDGAKCILNSSPADSLPAADSCSAVPAEATVEKDQSSNGSDPPGQLCRRGSVHDFTLARADRFLLGGLCLLAWLIEPTFRDSPLALSALMFVRVVPIFILGGSLYGHALAGAFIGTGLFFGLLGAHAISVAMWDTHLLVPVTTLLSHSVGIANLLLGFAVVGFLLCLVGPYIIRQGKRQAYRNSWRLATQVCVLVQLALVAELGHTAWRYATHTDSRSDNVTSVKMIHR